MSNNPFDRLVGTPHHLSPIKWVMCEQKHGTYIHKDAVQWYCVGCRVVHYILRGDVQ